MDEELQSVRAANEKLTVSAGELQAKLDLQLAKVKELKASNAQLMAARKTQMG
jgi:hypothetical protein